MAVLVSPVWIILSAISTSPVKVPVEPATVPPLILPVTLPSKDVDVVTPVTTAPLKNQQIHYPLYLQYHQPVILT